MDVLSHTCDGQVTMARSKRKYVYKNAPLPALPHISVNLRKSSPNLLYAPRGPSLSALGIVCSRLIEPPTPRQ